MSSKQLAAGQRTVSSVECRASRQDAGSRGKGHGSRVHCSLLTAHYPLSTAGAAIGLLMCLAILLQAAPARADAVDMLKKTYAGIQTVEARFNQKILVATLKRERESKGEFYYKRGKGFLWRYTSPSRKVFLYDGKALWQADEEQPLAIKERVDKGKVQGSFLDLVEDVSKLDEYFTIQEVAQDKDGFVFLLLPKKEGMLKQARMWVDTKYLVRQIEITEITGNTNTLSFSSVKVDKALNDALFIFKPGKKEIMER
ncbi:MAG TPA: outer membrane lipoprotein chaperone LolA [Syntrophorhabdales bacterium]|nr:outer membrane lipoprotein chaperone LolA [Syntrophorhabdales bacterium]